MEPGYVYIMRCNVIVISKQAVPYKIGRSGDPEDRLRHFSGYPDNVEIVHKIITNDTAWLERILHAFFEKKRTQAEWFALDEHDLKRLSELRIVDRIPIGFSEGFPVINPLEWGLDEKDTTDEQTAEDALLGDEGIENFEELTSSQLLDAVRSAGWKLSFATTPSHAEVVVLRKNGNVVCRVAEGIMLATKRAYGRARSIDDL